MFVEAHVDVEVLLDKRKWRNGKRGMVSFLLSPHENSEHKVQSFSNIQRNKVEHNSSNTWRTVALREMP